MWTHGGTKGFSGKVSNISIIYLFFQKISLSHMVNCICADKLLTDIWYIIPQSAKLSSAVNITYYWSQVGVKTIQYHQQIPTHYVSEFSDNNGWPSWARFLSLSRKVLNNSHSQDRSETALKSLTASVFGLCRGQKIVLWINVHVLLNISTFIRYLSLWKLPCFNVILCSDKVFSYYKINCSAVEYLIFFICPIQSSQFNSLYCTWRHMCEFFHTTPSVPKRAETVSSHGVRCLSIV